ncbi:MAG: RsmF rRNA methyltransferase first C-terminal domain-containing protein [Butyrivibrio sp.]
MQLPEKYLDNMKSLLGDEFDSYIQSFEKPRLYGLRVNTSKISVEDFMKISPFKLTPIPWIPNGFYYSEEDKPAKHPYYFAGLYYLQEPSAMTPAYVLPVNPNDRVLDLCAAPGGKSTELGAKLRGTGLLVSNDISASRAKALLKNIEVFGIGNVLVTCEYPEKLAGIFPEFFDKILVDAPCSGEGMFRKDNKLIKSWETQGPEFFAPLQKNILDSAALMLKPGGYLLYSTCTFSKAEDEDNIFMFLENHPDFCLERIYDYEGFTRAFGMEEAVRIFPHKMQGEGHFVALLHKNGEAFLNCKITYKGIKCPVEIQEFFEEFSCEYDLSSMAIQGEKVYLLPEEADRIKGIRTLRTGLLLGELKKNRFEPSQALAMTVNPSEYSTTVDFKGDSQGVIRYLKGETVEVSEGVIKGSSKNVLITVDGFPLGWGKLNGTVIKNKYLPGWRWM